METSRLYQVTVVATVRPNCHAYSEEVVLYEHTDLDHAIVEFKFVMDLYKRLYLPKLSYANYDYANALLSRYGGDIEWCGETPKLICITTDNITQDVNKLVTDG